MKKKRIGMILDQGFPPDVRVENEALSLINNGYEVHLLCYAFNNESPSEDYRGMKIHRIRTSRYWVKKMRALVNVFPFYDIFLSRHIAQFIEKNKIEILHVHDLYLLGTTLKINRKYKLPLVSDLHENYVEGLKHYRFANTFPGKYLIRIRKWEQKEIEWLQQVDHIIVVIEEAIERLKGIGVKKEIIVPVPNYLNIPEFENMSVKPRIVERLKDKFVISYIGAFDYHRGLHILIEGFSEFANDAPDAYLLLVGAGRNSDQLKAQADKLKVGSQVIFTGHQPHSDLPSYIEASDIGMVPHLKTTHTDNTIPHKLFNYMFKNKAVLVSNCAPLERIVKECECGEVYDNSSAEILYQKLKEMYDQRPRLLELGKNGNRCVVRKYNWKTSEKNLLKLYERI